MMGDIADMMLEGLLDEETGEYIGDLNEERYGMDAPGFPISYEREARERDLSNTVCNMCGKRLKTEAGLIQHCMDKHGRGT